MMRERVVDNERENKREGQTDKQGELLRAVINYFDDKKTSGFNIQRASLERRQGGSKNRANRFVTRAGRSDILLSLSDHQAI